MLVLFLLKSAEAGAPTGLMPFYSQYPIISTTETVLGGTTGFLVKAHTAPSKCVILEELLN